jgi:hypothetical protein
MPRITGEVVKSLVYKAWDKDNLPAGHSDAELNKYAEGIAEYNDFTLTSKFKKIITDLALRKALEVMVEDALNSEEVVKQISAAVGKLMVKKLKVKGKKATIVKEWSDELLRERLEE